MNDSNLFAHGADVTTKDILKRYGDIANRPPPKQFIVTSDSSAPQSRDGRAPSTPVFHRVDADQTQSVAWEQESSARTQGSAQQSSSLPTNGGHNQSSLGRGHTRGGSDGSLQGVDGPVNAQSSNGHPHPQRSRQTSQQHDQALGPG